MKVTIKFLFELRKSFVASFFADRAFRERNLVHYYRKEYNASAFLMFKNISRMYSSLPV